VGAALRRCVVGVGALAVSHCWWVVIVLSHAVVPAQGAAAVLFDLCTHFQVVPRCLRVVLRTFRTVQFLSVCGGLSLPSTVGV